MRRISLFVAVIAMALFASVSFGQITSGDLVGTVKDPSGAFVSNDTTTTNLATTFSTEELASLPTATVGLCVINPSLISPGAA
jgi:hypothetical protein